MPPLEDEHVLDECHEATLQFARGGTQGAEGLGYAESWYVENVLEELDSPGEWFYNATTRTLFYFPNATHEEDGGDVGHPAPPASSGFVATSLQVLIKVSGSHQHPVRDLAFSGLTLRDAASTSFSPHGLPSGGDWALPRQAAISLTGTDGVRIAANLFTHLDGNAIFAGGSHRRLAIESNEFAWLGGSAIALWGETSPCLNSNCTVALPKGVPMGPDGREGTQPMGTTVLGNLAREIGIWQKQSSFFFQAVSAMTTLRANVVFNGPRAALNFNDGFGGGDEIAQNLLLNMCRESSDHGPWNSWDRVPYITTLRTGRPSTLPLGRRLHHNFIIANYHAQEAVDTDDGSSFLTVDSNVLAYGENGLKAVFGGHHLHHHTNLYLFVGTCFDFTAFKGFASSFINNTCLFRTGYYSDCNLTPTFGHRVHGNHVASRDGKLDDVCGDSFAEWQKRGHDVHTTLDRWPVAVEVAAQAERLVLAGLRT